ncbi:Uma2 family endonuclease [Petroclostridium sp. X23]|uniref:Uma2 family endonuclease n=1 Tax=Petroclostridium sp. X23 TaxID=3045146 RepID=UPI0024ADEA6B|nr:Uma2 family endonuclease [Petroclostridium sp. X23]WHH60594.1 Uma2 family endonuclease [Petroclostridium sp. X23]
MPLPSQQRKYTYTDYLTWPEDESCEIIDGVPYMQAAPSWQHQSITGELYRQISNYFVNKPCRAFAAPFDLCLAEYNETDDEISNVVQPDVVVVCDESKLRKTGYFGVPTLIIETTSPATSRRDRVSKFNMYEKAGVKEYWIVDPEGKFVNVFILQQNKRYGRPETYTDENKMQIATFPDLIIDLNTVFANL